MVSIPTLHPTTALHGVCGGAWYAMYAIPTTCSAVLQCVDAHIVLVGMHAITRSVWMLLLRYTMSCIRDGIPVGIHSLDVCIMRHGVTMHLRIPHGITVAAIHHHTQHPIHTMRYEGTGVRNATYHPTVGISHMLCWYPWSRT